MPTDTSDLVQRLWQLAQIRQLKARYFRALDGKDWPAYQDTFTRDICVINHRTGTERRCSREEHTRFIRHLIGPGRSIHRGYEPEITLLAEDLAQGIWPMDDLIIYPPDDRPKGFRGWGYYHETYHVEDGQWRIGTMALQRTRYEPLSGGLPDTVEASPPSAGLVWGTAIG